MNFTLKQQKMIYDSVKYYRTNYSLLDKEDCSVCDVILNTMLEKMTSSVPVAIPPHRPLAGFGNSL